MVYNGVMRENWNAMRNAIESHKIRTLINELNKIYAHFISHKAVINRNNGTRSSKIEKRF